MNFLRFQNMNYRRRIFVLTVSVCLFVVSVIMWYIYGNVKKLLCEKEIESNLAYLEQTGASIDYMIGILNNTTYSMYRSNDVKQLMYREPSEDVYDYIKIMNRFIDSFVSANPAIHSAYIYNAEQNLYFSTNSSIFHVDEDFQKRMEQPEIPVKDFPILRRIDGQLVCTQMLVDSYETVYRHDDSGIFVNYKFDWMLDNMNVYLEPDSGDSLFLIDKEGNCFPAYEPFGIDHSELEGEMRRCQTLLGEQSAITDEWQGKRSIITTYRVPSTGWQLFKVVPLDELENDIALLRNTILLINLISALAIVSLYYGVSQWLYKPLNRIVEMLPAGSFSKNKDEFSLVESYYLQQLNEIKELRRISEANAVLLEEPIINRLLYRSESLPENEFSELYRIYRFHISFEQPYLVCVCAFDQMESLSHKFDPSKDKMLMLLLIKDVIKEVIGEHYQYDYSYSNDECMTILLQVNDEQPKELLLQTLRQLQSSLEREFESTVSIACSEELQGYRQASRGYRQAFGALQYRMVSGRSSILDAACQHSPTKRLNEYDSRWEKKILDAISQEEYPLADQSIDGFISELSCLDCQSIRIVLSIFFGKVKRVIYLSNEKRTEPLNMEEIDALFSERNLKFLEDLPQLMNLLLEYLESSREETLEYSPDAVQQAQRIVEQEYPNLDLSATFLAERVDVSSVQLGRLFKKQCGKSIPEYINDVRLEKAVEWIKSSNLTINEIALRVGYQNESYFFRVFKKKYGITPRQYEKEYRNITH